MTYRLFVCIDHAIDCQYRVYKAHVSSTCLLVLIDECYTTRGHRCGYLE